MTWRTIQILNILDHKHAFFGQLSDHHLNTGPFNNQAQIDHLNNRLVRFSDGYSIARLLIIVFLGLKLTRQCIRDGVAASVQIRQEPPLHGEPHRVLGYDSRKFFSCRRGETDLDQTADHFSEIAKVVAEFRKVVAANRY